MNIFDLTFFLKVVDVSNIWRREETENAELSTLLSLLLLSGGTQASSATPATSATPAISLGDPLTMFLLFQSFPHFRRNDFLPFLVAILGTQGYGTQGTQGNLLLLPLLLLSQSSHQPQFWDMIDWEAFREFMEKVEEQKETGTRASFNKLLESAAHLLDKVEP
jgi:hypothetical protein